MSIVFLEDALDMSNPSQVIWQDPTTNTDGSAIAVGEITGYQVGVRAEATGSPGTYPYQVTAPATAVSELLSLLLPVLPAGTYVAAVQAITPAGNSAWSAESSSFTLAALPNPPTGVVVK